MTLITSVVVSLGRLCSGMEKRPWVPEIRGRIEALEFLESVLKFRKVLDICGDLLSFKLEVSSLDVIDNVTGCYIVGFVCYLKAYKSSQFIQ